jgi:hypothetical protein
VKKSPLLLLLLAGILGVVLSGCFPEGEGKDELIKPNPLMGAAGGEREDQTAPVAPMSATGGNQTSSAFPSTDQPSTGN